MKNLTIAAALTAAFLFMPSGIVMAHHTGGDSAELEPDPPIVFEIEALPDERPFTPAGTSTVVDNATNVDGKEFFTIMTPDENVFYLVIDRQRGQDNVYFLNAVTENDLLPLAEQSEGTGENISVIPEIPDEPILVIEQETVEIPDPEPELEPEPEKENVGNFVMMALPIIVVIVGGVVGLYFKIYRPKQKKADIADDYVYYDDADPYGDDAQDENSGDYR